MTTLLPGDLVSWRVIEQLRSAETDEQFLVRESRRYGVVMRVHETAIVVSERGGSTRERRPETLSKETHGIPAFEYLRNLDDHGTLERRTPPFPRSDD